MSRKCYFEFMRLPHKWNFDDLIEEENVDWTQRIARIFDEEREDL